MGHARNTWGWGAERPSIQVTEMPMPFRGSFREGKVKIASLPLPALPIPVPLPRAAVPSGLVGLPWRLEGYTKVAVEAELHTPTHTVS